MDYRRVSFWLETAPEDATPRPPVPGDIDVDVAIVGAGFTGLWTAYYLAKRDPSMRIAVLERDTAGFGASGRNGGWCVGELAVRVPEVDPEAGTEGALAMGRALHDTIDEVGAAAAREGIDCHFAKGGTVTFASNGPQLGRLRGHFAAVRRLGFGEDDYRLLTPRETTEIIDATGVHGGIYNRHCAALHPGRLARGLAAAIERLGVTVYEQTAVTAIEPGAAGTPYGRVRADIVVRATEAYTASIPGHENAVLPIGNHMIVTEPLPAAAWDAIGLRRRETFEDSRHVIFYGQRTADDRFAFGGLAIPYRFRSGTAVGAEGTYERLRRMLVRLFPVVDGVAVTHQWSGVLGATRDTFPSVGYDAGAGYAWAGGYVGEGVAPANLAGRTLADLVTKEDSDLVRLPWVNRRPRDWEPEPWRWLEFHALSATLAVADAAESLTGRRQRWAERLLDVITR